MVNIGEGFKRPFNDIGKLILGIILASIPIVNLLTMGYGVRCIKTVLGKKKNMHFQNGRNGEIYL